MSLILDSVLFKVLLNLGKKRIFVEALISKWQHWHVLIPCIAIDSHFDNMPLGECDEISGTMDGKKYVIWGMKGPDYMVKIINTCSSLILDYQCKKCNKDMEDRSQYAQWAMFTYIQVLDLFFHFCLIMDDHNILCH